MYKKFVSNLPFSPALVGQLGFYAKRLRREQATRRLGLLFAALAIAMQSLAVWQPPQQASASSANDLINGGVHAKAEVLQTYDQAGSFATLLNYLGITRDDLAGLQETPGQACSKDESLVVFGNEPIFSTSEGEVTYQVPSGGQNLTFYARPLHVFDKNKTTCHKAFVGTSQGAGAFAIIQDSGNLALYQKDITAAPATPAAALVKSKTARSLTRAMPISNDTTVNPTERIEYTLTTTNTGEAPITQTIVDPMADTLEYAHLIDSAGGTLDDATKTLTWPNVTIAPGASEVRKVVVELLATIPDTPYSAGNPSSFDCLITNIYGSTLNIKVDCPGVKTVESTVQDLPTTGPGTNIVAGAVVLGVATYLYLRNRQLSREIKLVRHEFNGGTV